MADDKTIQLELTLTLPDTVAREAEANGLLTPQALETLLRTELRRRHVEHLFAAMERLASVSLPSLTAAEIEAEIQAVRTAKRGRRARRR